MVQFIVVQAGEDINSVLDSLETRDVYVQTLPAGNGLGGYAGRVKPVIGNEVPDGSVILFLPSPVDQLIHVVKRLMDPGGCPWDQAQTHESLKRYLIEETYEVVEAIDANDTNLLVEELGDLLLQPVMHAQIADQRGAFNVNDVAQGIVDKLVRRHPHVFGDVSVKDADEVLKNWDRIKQTEKKDTSGNSLPKSILGNIPRAMPALLRAHEVSECAARCGFEWPDLPSVFEKLEEEKAELKEAIALADDDAIEAELGDVLFTVVNLARWLKVEPEEALRKMVNRFSLRFETMEAMATVPLSDLSPEKWQSLWELAKSKTSATR